MQSTLRSSKPTKPHNSLAVLISGRGSNMEAIVKACHENTLDASVDLVISNRPEALGLETAQQWGIETAVIDHTVFDTREAFDDALNERLCEAEPTWIVLAGFMRILTARFVNQWQGQIVNIHPSLLPKYPGLDTHARAIAAGDTYAGASVHIVSPELDAGPVIEQVKVPIAPNDTPETLAQRVLKEEHSLYINALQRCMTQSSN